MERICATARHGRHPARGGTDPWYRDVARHRRLRDRDLSTAAVPAGPRPPRSPSAGPQTGHPQARAGLRLDHDQRRVWADGREVTLTYQEFELLAFLSEHPATVFSRADLVEHVWHHDLPGEGDQRPVTADSRTVDVHISRLRQKLGPRHGQCLVTEYRVGYQFRPPAA